MPSGIAAVIIPTTRGLKSQECHPRVAAPSYANIRKSETSKYAASGLFAPISVDRLSLGLADQGCGLRVARCARASRKVALGVKPFAGTLGTATRCDR
jgi:hypothetical protein